MPGPNYMRGRTQNRTHGRQTKPRRKQRLIIIIQKIKTLGHRPTTITSGDVVIRCFI